MAREYLRGQGLEIGALHLAMELPVNSHARYVDRMSIPDLLRQYPELAEHPLVPVDIIDNGETLATIPSASQDFVIASHFIEHTQDPIGSLENWLRVLKPGGIAFIIVPHKAHTFDKDRPTTSLAHLQRDHSEGPQWSRRAHFEEWVRLVNRLNESEVDAFVEKIMAMDYSIHFHVWTELEFLEMLHYCFQELKFPGSLEMFRKNEMEFIVILRKQPAA